MISSNFCTPWAYTHLSLWEIKRYFNEIKRHLASLFNKIAIKVPSIETAITSVLERLSRFDLIFDLIGAVDKMLYYSVQ